MTDRRTLWLGYGACALASCLWGTGFYFGRLALNEMSVEWMVLYRFAFACVGLVPVALMHRIHLNGREWGMVLASAALGVPLQFLLQFHGLALTNVSHASLMVGTLPMFLAIAAVVFAGERMDGLGWVALAGSTVGSGLIVLGGHSAGGHSSLRGDLMIVLSLIISLAWILLSKRLMRSHGPAAITSYTIVIGAAMLAIWVLIPWLAGHGEPPPLARVSRTAWVALAVGGLLCTTTTTLLWNWGIHHVPASRAGVFLNLEPAVGSVLGVQLLGEQLGPLAWVGGGLLLTAAVMLTTRSQTTYAPEVLE